MKLTKSPWIWWGILPFTQQLIAREVRKNFPFVSPHLIKAMRSSLTAAAKWLWELTRYVIRTFYCPSNFPVLLTCMTTKFSFDLYTFLTRHSACTPDVEKRKLAFLFATSYEVILPITVQQNLPGWSVKHRAVSYQTGSVFVLREAEISPPFCL